VGSLAMMTCGAAAGAVLLRVSIGAALSCASAISAACALAVAFI